jgi:peptidoglycan/LPS O-acetylase OafA/YrhL
MLVGDKPNRNLEIEALRGVAILFVLFSHVGGSLFFWDVSIYEKLRWFIQPGTGVDLFFCISGYVIARQYASAGSFERTSSAFAELAFPFWVRRFWRLVPTAWLWLALPIFLSIIFPGFAGDFVLNLKDALSAVLQIANFHFYECLNRINATQCGAFSIYWSLSLEEQFYFVFPFILFFVPARFRVAFFLTLALSQLFLERGHGSFRWFFRTDAISLGVLIALLQQAAGYQFAAPTLLTARWKSSVWFLALAALLAIVDAPSVHFVQWVVGVAAIISAALVFTASFDQGYLLPPGAIRSALVYVGARSYSLYVIHIPASHLDSFLKSSAGIKSGFADVFYFALLFGLVELNYRFWEMPMREKGKRIARTLRDKIALRRSNKIETRSKLAPVKPALLDA